jgi:ferrous iron transport protein A
VETVRLSDLRPGECCIVTSISAGSRITARLMELGLVPGAAISVLRKAPFGDPVQYRVCGAVISMRAAEAACVQVQTDSAVQRHAAAGQLVMAGN